MDKQWVACRRTATTGILTVEKLGGTTLRQQPHCHNTRCRAACPIDGPMPVSWCSPTQHCIHAPMHQCTNAPTSHARLKLGHVHCCAAYRRGTPASSMHYNQEVLGRALVCVHENFQNPQWLCQNRSRRFVLHSRITHLPSVSHTPCLHHGQTFSVAASPPKAATAHPHIPGTPSCCSRSCVVAYANAC